MSEGMTASMKTRGLAPEKGEGLDGGDQEPLDLKDLAGILEKHAGARGGLIAILEDIQARCGYLPENILRIVAERTGQALVDVYAVATFYSSFSLKPRGRHVVCACLGTACHVRGAPRVVEAFEQQLDIHPGETTPDREFTLETVNCLGACALGPVVVIDGRYFSKTKKNQVRQLIEDTRKGLNSTEHLNGRGHFPLELRCTRCNHSLMDPTRTMDGYPAVRITITSDHLNGRLYLSSLYGSRQMLMESDITSNTAVTFLCPTCHKPLTCEESCFVCGAPVAAMNVTGGGVLKVCSRLDCQGRMLDLL